MNVPGLTGGRLTVVMIRGRALFERMVHNPALSDVQSRTVLSKATQENFPVAPFFVPRSWRADLMAIYGFARLVDAIGDGDLPDDGRTDAVRLGLSPDAGRDRLALLDAFETDLHRVFATPHNIRHPLLHTLQPTVRRHSLSLAPFLSLIEANRQDQVVHRYAKYDDLLDYCRLSANPVGRLVLDITSTATAEQVRYSDAICTALQIIEHLQDVAEDLSRDRIYLPAEDMQRFGVTEADLSAPAAGPRVRALVAYEAERARGLLDEGAPLLDGSPGWIRLVLAGFIGGGRAALRAITAAHYDVLAEPPKAGSISLVREVATALRRKRSELDREKL